MRVLAAGQPARWIEMEGRRYLQKSPLTLFWKRAFDIALSGMGLLASVPLFLIIAVLIKVDSRGPVFYRQRRVGRHRQPFMMWKFRKMMEDLPAQGPMLTARFDYRMTRIGRFLERTKLDELPQLIDVLRGEMSVVGPRPEVPKFVEHHPEKWDEVLSVKPGIFGPNQLLHRNESELFPVGLGDVERFYIEEVLPGKLAIDAEYARRASFTSDLWLLVRGLIAATLGAVTWRTVVTRRAQIANLAVLGSLGVAGMALAHVATDQPLGSELALHALLLAALVKPVFVVALKIPKSLASSMTADDFLRQFWCALGSAAAIVFGMFWLGHRDMGRLVLILDTFFFLAVLFTYKLVLYSFHLTFQVQRSRQLARRLVKATFLAAPASVLLAVTARHGPSIWSAQTDLYLSMLLLAAVIRPTILLLLRPPTQRRGAASWLVSEWPHLLLATVTGSGLIVLGSVLVGQRILGRGDVVLDAIVFNAMMTGLSLWENQRLARASRKRAEGGAAHAGRRRLLIVGSGGELSSYVAALVTLPEADFEISGLVTPHEAHRTSTVGGHHVLGEIADIPGILDAMAVDSIVVLQSGLDGESLQYIEEIGRRRGVGLVRVPLLTDLLARPPGPIA